MANPADQEAEPFYDRHIFMCANVVADSRCCGAKGSEKLCMYLRRRLKELGIRKVAATKTGCMGRCLSGPSLVIYPDNVWYSPHNEADIDDIISTHLLGGNRVTRLLMPAFDPPLPEEI